MGSNAQDYLITLLPIAKFGGHSGGLDKQGI